MLRFPAADRSRDRFIRTHAEMVLDSLPPDAVLLSRHWDALVSPALYLQAIEGRRLDVTIVDTELLRRSWYYPQIRRRDAELLAPLESTVSALLVDLVRFERGDSYDPVAIEKNYRGVMKGIALAHRDRRPAGYTPEALMDLTPDQQANFFAPEIGVPDAAVFLLRADPLDAPPATPPDVSRLLASGYRPGDRIHQQVIQHWTLVANSRLRYLQTFGRAEEAAVWEDALRILATSVR